MKFWRNLIAYDECPMKACEYSLSLSLKQFDRLSYLNYKRGLKYISPDEFQM